MKVGISYAVELEDIPEEVENLLRDIQWDLSGKLEEIIEMIRSSDYSKLDREIKQLRHNLATVDTRLEDCYTILLGYVKVLRDLAAQRAAAEPGPPPVEDISPAVVPITPVSTDEYDTND